MGYGREKSACHLNNIIMVYTINILLYFLSKYSDHLKIFIIIASGIGGDVAQPFRNNPNLQQFMLTDVTSTGRILGTGSYGSVVEVSKSTSSLELSCLYFSCSIGQVSASCLCWQEAPCGSLRDWQRESA